MRGRRFWIILLLLAARIPAAGAEARPRTEVHSPERPDILILSIDTLRTDRLSFFGYHRPTSPNLDRAMARGVSFTEARTVEPLTAPAMASMITSLHPHEHGSTRNGLKIRPRLMGFTQVLGRRGYGTAAFVGAWPLKDDISGLAEHFDVYEEVLERKRWFGLVAGEATAAELNDRALAWLDDYLERDSRRPFLLWIHYVEPHAPYKLQEDYLERLGIRRRDPEPTAGDRYDTEIAFLDAEIGRLLEELGERIDLERTLTVFVADHGESLGEHSYWGHGRHAYDPTLRIPMSLTWPARLPARTIDAPALIFDLGPTLLSLAGLPVPDFFQGYDWAPVLLDGQEEPADRVTLYQAHKGAVLTSEDPSKPRQNGLLEVARIENGSKEILRVPGGKRRVFDLHSNPREDESEVAKRSEPSPELLDWLETVRQGLAASDQLPPPSLSEEDIETLRALGYIE